MTQVRAVIFDLDGCLVDSEVMSLDTVAAEMSAVGLHVPPEDLCARFLGVSIGTIATHVADATGRPCPENFAERIETRLLARYPDELTLIPGAADLLDRLEARGIAMAIATGGSLNRLRTTLDVAGLAARFADRAFSADEVERGKPAPDLFLHAARHLGVDPAECAVMEDSPHGITGARAAGMHAVGFTGGSHLARLRDAHAQRLSAAGAGAVLPALAGMESALLHPAVHG